jgi:protein-tyrosine-phosphatase
MATAFAERERDRRGLDVDIVTGGTRPADRVHGVVVTAMDEMGIDLAGRTPREIEAHLVHRCDDDIVNFVCRPGAARQNFDAVKPATVALALGERGRHL